MADAVRLSLLATPQLGVAINRKLGFVHLGGCNSLKFTPA